MNIILLGFINWNILPKQIFVTGWDALIVHHWNLLKVKETQEDIEIHLFY